jgi:hypothetical protein
VAFLWIASALLWRFAMKDLNLTAMTERADVLCESEPSQLAQVTGGYQPVFVPVSVFINPFGGDPAPAPGVHIVDP